MIKLQDPDNPTAKELIWAFHHKKELGQYIDKLDQEIQDKQTTLDDYEQLLDFVQSVKLVVNGLHPMWLLGKLIYRILSYATSFWILDY